MVILFLLISIILLAQSAIASQDDEGNPPAERAGDPLTVYAAGALNSLRGGLTHRGGASTTTVVGALSRLATSAMSLPSLPSNGPFTAQCLASFSPMAGGLGPPPGYIYDQVDTDPLFHLPWICAVVPELHGSTCGFVDPAFYSPTGKPIERTLFWAGIKRHMLAGRIFFPKVESPDYSVPNPGDKVTVYYADVSSFSGGKYVYVNNNPLSAPSRTRPSREGPSRNPDVNFPSDSSDAPLSALEPIPSTTGQQTVYPDNCSGYNIDGVKYFAAGNVNSPTVVYYIPGYGNNACSDNRSAIRNLLSAMLPNYFTIALNMGSHSSSSPYRGDSTLQSFLRQFKDSTPAEFNTVFSGIEAKIIEQITGTPAATQRGRTNIKRAIAVFSAGHMAFDEMYNVHDGAMFQLDGSVISGIGFLDSMYGRGHNRRIIRLSRDSRGNIKVMGVHNDSIRPRGDAAKGRFDRELNEAGGHALRVRDRHNRIPAEYINTVIVNIT